MKASGFENLIPFGYHDRFKGSAQGSIGSMTLESVRYICGSPRLRTLFPTLFMLFAGWILAQTYVPIVITSLYDGPDPNSAVGIVMGAAGVLTLVLSPIVGTLADRYGHLRVLLIGSVLSLLLWPIPALLRDLVSFGIAWAILNGLVSAVFALSFSVLSGSADEHYRARVMSFAFLPVNVGHIIGPIVGSFVTRHSIFAIFPTAAVFTAIGVAGLVLAQRKRDLAALR